MSLVLKDRVRETATVVGTGDAALLGAVTGFQSFSVVGNTNACYYAIADQSGGDWEVGIGTYSTTGPTLARTTVLASSNSGSKVSFTGGTKDVFLTYPSEKAVYLDASDVLNVVTIDATTLEVTNIKAQDGTAAITLAGSTGVATFTANPILNAATANGVAYLNGSKVLTTGSALTFDGTNFVINGKQTIIGSTTDALTIVSDSGSSNGFRIYNNSSTDTAYLMNHYNGAMVFGITAAEQMRLTSTGLGIGTSSPVSTLTANGNATIAPSAGYWFNGYYSGGYKYWQTGYAGNIAMDSLGNMTFSNTAASGSAGAAATVSERMRLDSSGNLGLGVTPNGWDAGWSAMDFGGNSIISGNSTMSVALNAYRAGTNWIYKNTAAASNYYQSSGVHSWYTAPSGTAGNAISFTQAMTLDANGNLLVGTASTSPSSNVGVKIYPDGRVYGVSASSANTSDSYGMYSTGAAAYRFYVGWGGTVYATSTTISAISDIRYKENIRDLNVGLAEVMELKPRVFDWKEGKGKDIKNDRGFIAQEFEQVFPDLIDEWKDPAPEGEEPYKSVRQDLIPVLVKAIQEQQELINQLTARVAQLEGN